MRRAANALGLGLGVLALARCALLVDVSGLAGAPEGDAGPASTGDATSNDAAIDGDSGTRDAATARFCETVKSTFCADFDGPDLLEGWIDPNQEVGGSLTPSTRARSAPTSLLAVMPRRETAKGYASVAKELPGPWSLLIVDLDLYLEAPAFKTNDSNAGLFCASFYAGSSSDGMCMSVAETNTYFGGSGPAFPKDRWVHVRYSVDPKSKIATATVDDAPFASGPFTLPAGTGAPRMLVTVGVLGYNAPAPAFSATFDNVRITIP